MNEFTISDEELCKKFQTNCTNGLSNEEAKRRLKINGRNSFRFLNNEKNFTFFIKVIFGGYKYFIWNNLLFCLILYGIEIFYKKNNEGNMVYLVYILLFLILLASIKTLCKRKVNTFMLVKLRRLIGKKVKVIRSSEKMKINIEELVRGDIVEIEAGDLIPADLSLVKSENLRINNVFLTGEMKKIEENYKKPTNQSLFETENVGFFAGLVTKGKAKGLVVNTGKDTMMSKMVDYMIHGDRNKCFIRKEINHIKYLIKITGAVMAVFSYVIFFAAGKTGMESAMFLCGYNIASICLYLQLNEYKENVCKME